MKTENEPIITGAPMALEQKRKLLIFAISSLHKDVDGKALTENKQISLTLGAGYSPVEAIEAARQGLVAQGLEPGNFVLGFQSMYVEAERLVAFPNVFAIPEVETLKEEKPVDLKSKSKDNLIAYVRYVFDIAGTEEQKRMAEWVIKKFKDNSFKKKLS